MPRTSVHVVMWAALATAAQACGGGDPFDATPEDGGVVDVERVDPATGRVDGCYVPGRPAPWTCPDGAVFVDRRPEGQQATCWLGPDPTTGVAHGLLRSYGDGAYADQMFRRGELHGLSVVIGQDGQWDRVTCFESHRGVWLVDNQIGPDDPTFEALLCRPCP